MSFDRRFVVDPDLFENKWREANGVEPIIAIARITIAGFEDHWNVLIGLENSLLYLIPQPLANRWL